MKIYFLHILYMLTTVVTYGQEVPNKAASVNSLSTSDNQNYPPHQWNSTIGSSDLDITRSTSGESLMGNFICDVILSHTQSDFAFVTFGEIYSELYRGMITQLDMFRLVPFDRKLIVMEVSGDTLKQVIEKSLGGVPPGMSIAGGKVEFEADRPPQNRLTFLQVGEFPLYPQKIYRVVTLDYLAFGSSAFDFLRNIDQLKVYKTGTLLRDVLTDYITQNSPLDQSKVSIDGRWIKK